jgi:predicted nuclease of restriction endonuclease-like (RecB) superfamily
MEAEAEGDDEPSEASGFDNKVTLKPWNQKRSRSMGHEAPGGRPVPLIDRFHRLMHLWKAGEIHKVDEFFDEHGLRRHELFHRVLQSLIELSKASSEERSLVEKPQQSHRRQGGEEERAATGVPGDGGRAGGGGVMAKRKKGTGLVHSGPAEYGGLVTGIADLLEQARRGAARAVNSILTATYWEVGRRIVEFEQGGKARAEYGEKLLKQLAHDLTSRFGRWFSERNLEQMRGLYRGWEISQTPSAKLEARVRLSDEIFPTLSGISAGMEISQTPSAQLEARATCPTLSSVSAAQPIPPTVSAESEGHAILQTPSSIFDAGVPVGAFPLSWSHYVRLMSVANLNARVFYESEAIRGGWSVRQLDRQISTQFFERASHSKQQAAMPARGQKPKPADVVSVEDEIRDPYLLEFLDLKDEYSESDLEDALIEHLEAFLLELGAGFTFVARQKRIRIGAEWYRIDLLLFHRRLKCLVVIDLKLGKFTHADAGQMSLYLT